jgi:hypothetical protein
MQLDGDRARDGADRLGLARIRDGGPGDRSLAKKLESLGVGKAPRKSEDLTAFIDAQNPSLVATAKDLLQLETHVPVGFASEKRSSLVETRLKKPAASDPDALERGRFITAEIRVADDIKNVVGALIAATKALGAEVGDTKDLVATLEAIARRPSVGFHQHAVVQKLFDAAISQHAKLKRPEDYYGTPNLLGDIESALWKAREAAERAQGFLWKGIDPRTLKASQPYQPPSGPVFLTIALVAASETEKTVRLSTAEHDYTCTWKHLDGTWQLSDRVGVGAKGQAASDVELTPRLEALLLQAHLSLATPARAVWALPMQRLGTIKIIKVELEEGGYAYIRPQNSPFNARAAQAEHGYVLLAQALGYYFQAPAVALDDPERGRCCITAEIPGYRHIRDLRQDKESFPAGSAPLLAVIDLLDFVTNNDDRNDTNIGVDARGRVRGIDVEKAFMADDRYSLLWGRHYDQWNEAASKVITADPAFVAQLEALTPDALHAILTPAGLSTDEIQRCFERIRFLVELVAANGPEISKDILQAFRTKGLAG